MNARLARLDFKLMPFKINAKDVLLGITPLKLLLNALSVLTILCQHLISEHADQINNSLVILPTIIRHSSITQSSFRLTSRLFLIFKEHQITEFAQIKELIAKMGFSDPYFRTLVRSKAGSTIMSITYLLLIQLIFPR